MIASGQPSSSPSRTTSAAVSTGSVVPGMIGTPAAFIRSRASVFEPIASIASGGGPIQVSPAVVDGAGEGGVLGEEPVAGVDRLGSGPRGRLDDLLLVQVALGRSTGTEQPGLVGNTNVQGSAVGLRVDGHRGDLELAQRPEDADGDLAAVGDEDFREGAHGRRILHGMIGLADQLTLARIVATPFVVILFIWDFPGHAYWATALFIAAMATDQIDGWLARRQGRTTPLGSLLDPVADKVLVLATMIVLVGEGAFPGWMVAAIVARELLVSGLRLAAVERGDRPAGP